MPRLPPVPISPQARLAAKFCCGEICCVSTLDQSHSSSSTTSCASPVSVPCPISERAMRITQRSSGCTTTHTLSSLPALCACASNGAAQPSARPPAAAAVETTKSRRDSSAAFEAKCVVIVALLQAFATLIATARCTAARMRW